MKKSLSTLVVLLLAGQFCFAQLKVLSNGSTQGGLSNGRLRIESINGKRLDLGANNNDFAHFYSNSIHGFYFGSNVWVNGYLRSYNRDFELQTSGSTRLLIAENTGNVGLGVHYFPDPDYKLDVQGVVSADQYHINSDERLKRNINRLDEITINKIYDLNGWTYYRENHNHSYNNSFGNQSKSDTTAIPTPKPDSTLNIGLIAQEVQGIYPELVNERDNGYLTIDYISLIPILIEALKQQQVKLELLEDEIIDQDNQKASEVYFEQEDKVPFLSQNRPNPFNENCNIKFYLPSTVNKAIFCVYDLQGKQIKSQIVSEREFGEVVILGSELQPGMYRYALIADDKVIDTHSMILTDK